MCVCLCVGTAITFFTEADMAQLRPIANVIKLSGCPVPDWMLTIKKVRIIIVVNIIYRNIMKYYML
jgi:hypothetical protein